MRKLTFLAVVLSLIASGASTLRAEGIISAVSFLPVPAGSAISVRPLDNSDHNLILQKDFEDALKNKGYAIKDDATLILTFETRDDTGAWSGGGENSYVELSNNSDQSGTNAPRVRFNLFNSSRGGILNPNRRESTRTVTPSSFRIDVTVDDKSNGKRMWQGWSSAGSRVGTSQETSRNMIPILVDGLGQTIRQKTYSFNQ
ncbi:MAG: hypothetical protein HN719_09515 [Alphaproteobacteria bacterium]|nr:hypothetical protein [Alphaproteobacteria bacterium]